MHHAIFSAKLRIFLASLPPVYSRGAKYRGYFNGIGACPLLAPPTGRRLALDIVLHEPIFHRQAVVLGFH